MVATRDAYDAWNSSALHPKRPSSSRFSAASFRGLTGHHTAPAREMPKTLPNARGSLADRIATRSPGWTPRRASAAATWRESACTSA